MHAKIYVDSNTHYDALKDVYVPGEFKNPDMSINAVSLEQYGEDYIRPNADLESRPQSKSMGQLNCMYPEWLDAIFEFQDFEYQMGLELIFKPKMQTHHRVGLPIETSLNEN